MSVQRLLATLVFTAIVVVQRRGVPDGLLILAPIAFVWEVSTFVVLQGPGWRRFSAFWLIVADLVLLSIGIFISGRSRSDLLMASLLVIPATAFTFSTRRVLVLACLVILAGLIPMLYDAADGAPGVGHRLALFLLPGFLALVVVTVFARVSNDMTRRLATLSAERRQLLVERMARDDSLRAELSQELHDDALQTMLAVSQDLEEAGAGDDVALGLGRENVLRAIAALSSGVHRIHPGALTGAELGATLPALLDRYREEAGVGGETRIDEALAARRDERVYRVARELVDNASRHARATRIDLAVELRDGAVVLCVTDDGIGYVPEARGALVAHGRLGLASVVEQVESAGGELTFRAGDRGAGTEACARLPLGRAA